MRKKTNENAKILFKTNEKLMVLYSSSEVFISNFISFFFLRVMRLWNRFSYSSLAWYLHSMLMLVGYLQIVCLVMCCN